MTTFNPSTKTIHLTDTADSFKRTIMVTTRGKKVTMVMRWKSRTSGKRHLQRTTLSRFQVSELIQALQVNSLDAFNKGGAQ
jgi:hypothetical protein